MKKRKIGKIIGSVLLILLAVFLAAGVIPPAVHHSVTPEQTAAEAPFPADLGDANERILCIDDNREALLWRLRVIRQAQKELIFTTYSYVDDEGGQDIMAALADAADRGVHVRILVDGLSGFLNLKRSEGFQALAAMPNVEAKFYNPVNLLLPWRLNYRMHDKYVIADNTVYILGGRNTKNLSLGDYQEKKDYDRDLLVYSPADDSRNSLHQVQDYFASVWNLKQTRPFPGKSGGEEKLRTHFGELQKEYPEAFTPVDWTSETEASRGICLIHNPVEPANKAPVVWEDLMTLMGQGTESVVQTPYIICNDKMYRDLEDLTDRGSATKIILNAVESGANPWGCTDYLNEQGHLRGTGTELYEYQGDHSSHAKTVIIDDELSVIGSFNFDMRSAYLDTEMMLVIDSPELNAHLREQAAENMRRSLQVLPDGTMGPGDAWPDQKIPPAKRALYRILQLILPPVRHLL